MRASNGGPGRQRGKMSKEQLLFLAFIAFVVAAIGGMMVLNYYGEKVMGDASKIHNAVGT